MTIADNLQTLIDCKADMKSAIESKGATVSGGLSTYADAIRSIEGGGILNMELPINTKFGYSEFNTIPLFNTSDWTDMTRMFYICRNLTSVPLFDTSKVTDMSYMFYSCKNLTSISQLDTSNVTNMSNMFRYCDSLITVPLFNTSKVTDMSMMFYASVDNSGGGVFADISKLESVPLFDTSNVTDMSNMFQFCCSLTSVPLFDTSKVTNMNAMFYDCTSLTEIPPFNTSNLRDATSIFYCCNKLVTIPLLDFSNVTKVGTSDGLLYGCNNIVNVGGFKNLGMQKDFTGFIRLTAKPRLAIDSFLNIVNNLYDRASAGYSIREILVDAEFIDILSDNEIAIATNKGWAVNTL